MKTLKDRPSYCVAADHRLVPDEPPRPTYLPARQLARGQAIFSLIAGVTLKRSEDDLDYHLVLRAR